MTKDQVRSTEEALSLEQTLRLALDALEYTGLKWPQVEEAITAIKAALEAKDEPVATKNNDGVTLHLGWDDLPVGTKLYATPPQRPSRSEITWVGLTNDEVNNFAAGCHLGNSVQGAIYKAEAKLKERNT